MNAGDSTRIPLREESGKGEKGPTYTPLFTGFNTIFGATLDK